MRPTRVLIAEDQDSARWALGSILRDEGYQVVEAVDGEEAAAQLATFAPDIVLSDLQMPKLDGMGLLRAAMSQAHKPAFVMMTSTIPAELAAQAKALGCSVVLSKPLDLDRALSALKSASNQRG